MFTELSKLFANPLRIKIIKYLSQQPDIKVRPADITRIVGGTKEKVATELTQLARVSACTERAGKEGKVYSWNSAYHLSTQVKNFVESATNLSDAQINKAFRRIAGVQTVVVAGVLVGEERSSVDLLIIAKKQSQKRINNAIHKLEEHTIVPLRYAVMEQVEFISRREAYDRLIRDVLDFPYRVVLGRITGR